MKKQTNKNTKKIVKGFKAFDIDKNGKMVCRDFIYEEGKTYVCNDAPKICESGFHFCKSPLDVLKYYPIIDNNMNIRSSFAKVKAYGEIVDEGDEVVDGMRIVHVVIFRKELRPVGDALHAEVRAAIPI